MGENKIIAVHQYLNNWIGCQDDRNSDYNRLTIVCSVEKKGKTEGPSRGVAIFLFLCTVAVLGSPLILVNMILIKVHSFFRSITSNAVSTFAMNTKTFIFSPLNGTTNYKASPSEIYFVILVVLLLGLATSVSKLG
jgi:hypothetical protein